jgi:hypothetical protein
MPFRLIASLLLAAALVSACGEAEPPDYPVDASDEEQIRAVVEIANVAVENRDGYLMCREVLPRDGVRSQEDVDRCGEELTAAMEENPDDWPDSDLELSRVVVDGNYADARGTVDGETSHYDFVRQQGRWWMVVFD